MQFLKIFQFIQKIYKNYEILIFSIKRGLTGIFGFFNTETQKPVF